MAAVECGHDLKPAASEPAACDSCPSKDQAERERSRSRSPRCSAATACSTAASQKESAAETIIETSADCIAQELGKSTEPANEDSKAPSENLLTVIEKSEVPGVAPPEVEPDASIGGTGDDQPAAAKQEDQPATAKQDVEPALPEEIRRPEVLENLPASDTKQESAAVAISDAEPQASDEGIGEDEIVVMKKKKKKCTETAVPEEVLRRFIEENELDAAAEKALRDLSSGVQRKVLDEGPCSGSDKSATLERRIRRLADDSPERPAAKETGEAGSSLSSADLERFIVDNDLEKDTAQVFREQPRKVQRRVVAEGVVTGRDKSAIVISRIRRAKNELFSGSADGEVSATVPSGRGSGALSEETVERFIREHDLDKYAESTLRSQTEDVQVAVIAEGPVIGDNKSKMVMGRIKRVQQAAKNGGVASSAPLPPPPGPPPPPGTEAFTRALQQQVHTGAYPMSAAAGMYGMPGYYGYQMPYGYYPQAYPPPGYGYSGPYGFGPPPAYGAPGAYGMPPGSPPGYGHTAAAVEDFARQNALDGSALVALREQKREVQQKVISEGFLSGKNKSAVLMSRIRKAAEQVSREPHSGSRSRHEDPISAFIRENTLDTGAAQKLRDQPSDVQKRVLDEGPLTGSNRSAILIGRIRRIRETPF